MSALDTLHSCVEVPDKPGKYWVLCRFFDKSKNEVIYQDDSYATWNGITWDREGWDCWYGISNPELRFINHSLVKAEGA